MAPSNPLRIHLPVRSCGYPALGLPPLFFAVVVVTIVTYLVVVQVLKQRFYASSGWSA